MNKYMEELTQMLQTGLEEYATSEKYRDLLRVMSLFHNYSANNCLLIALQCPHASYVAGYTSWRNNFHRQVKKGEKAIRIISPVKYKKKNEEDEEEERIGFKSASVFDISSTVQIDSMEPVTIGVEDLQGHVENYKDFLDAFQSVSPVPVDFRLFDGDARGYYSDTEKIIVIQDGMTERQSVKTLVHEIAHAMLHTKEKLQEHKKDRKQKELEAESVAYVVCEHFGFYSEDYSFPYIVGWGGTGFQDILKESMSTIQKTADEIITGVNQYFENNKN
ncbi:ArdC-like ssDNA-binding domain-containing protein [Mediterraneibacter gnavus]|uniref:ArdC-like ssDNA-binding domain-containing protein n=1 Tax=Mediterraneibacter gnavus TaxID=33038 RepID=UPI003568EB9C